MRHVLSLDNTNTLEGHFSTLKSRIQAKTSTLLDVYEAVTFTERAALAENHPASPSLPPALVDCLADVISLEVLSMMSYRGVCNFLEMRFKRTEDTERCFVEALQRLHAARRSSFTAQFLHTLDSFLPARTKDAINLDRFTELEALRDFDPANLLVDSPG